MDGRFCLSRKRGLETGQLVPSIDECSTLAGRPRRDSARLTTYGDLRIYDRLCLDWGWGEDRLVFDSCHGGGGNQATKYNSELKVTKLIV